MSEQVNFSQEEQVMSQGETTEPVSVENTPPAQEQRVRLADEEKAAIAQEVAKAFRAMQSMTDKAARKIAEDTRKQIAELRANGAQITAELEAQIVNNAVNRFKESEDAGNVSAQEQPVSRPEAQTPAIDPVTATAQLYLQRAGITFEETDPELKLIDRTTDDPDIFLTSVKKAIAAKKARLAIPIGSPAAVPGAIGTGSAPADHTQSYIKEMLAARGKGYAVGNAIKEKYRKLGVDVDNTRLTW